MTTEPALLRVFVYGTLKRGRRNHLAYCSGAAAIEPARIFGRLYHLPAGYPMLVVPDSAMLAIGSSQYAQDASRQHDDQWPPACTKPMAADSDCKEGEWEEIIGELLTFDDPATRLPALDRLEDFRPGETEAGNATSRTNATSLYVRVLVRLTEPAGLIAWTYVAPNGRLPPGARRCAAEW